MELYFSKDSKKPKALGLPQLKIKSECKNTIYLPRFKLEKEKLIVELGHYWGFGAYYVDTLMEHTGGLNLCGWDYSLDSFVDSKEMGKFVRYMNKYQKKIVSKLKSEF